jgi:hypothetical protein
MELTFTKGHITRDFTGDYHIILVAPKEEQSNMELLYELLQEDCLKVVKIKKYHKRRSLNANSYAWVLITEIANKLRASKDEVYLQMLKRYGQSQIIKLLTEGLPILLRAIKYYEIIKEDGDCTYVKVYTGSSEYDTKEMAILIDGIVSEATELKIPTMTPGELERIKEQWGR